MSILCLIIASLLIHSQAYPISLDNCPDSCGNTTIPYPFGTRPGCYLEEHFYIRCDTTSDPPKAFLGTGNIVVQDIMLSHSEMRIMNFVAHQCYGSDGSLNSSESTSLSLGKFPLSQFRNKFTVVGCDVYAYFRGSRTSLTGCTVICGNLTDVSNGTCTGLGCCQIDIPRLAITTKISLNSFNQHTLVSSFDPCSYAFVVEEHRYTFNSLDFRRLVDVKSFPVILDWTIGSQTCVEAKRSRGRFACKANSDCFNSTNAPGYKCACKQGFEGNPYHPDGCHDIDECKVYHPGPCYEESKCVNLIGGYECHCPHGYEGNGKLNGTGLTGCRKKPTSPYIIAALVAGVSSCCAGATGAWLYFNYKLKLKVKLNLRRERYKKNGGSILENEDSGKILKHYTEKELKEATKNYQDDMILVGRQGDKGTMYKGEFPDDKTVAIKKSDVVAESQAHQFINEIVLVSTISHPNLVKLVGCCLETEVPLLVYELVSNETLFDRIQRSNDNKSSMPWDTRLKIALGVAEALSYLHSDGPLPVVHGNVQSTSILLDENCTPKLSDFGAAKFASLGKASSTTFVEERSGYLDPEYLQTNTLTQESDVYSFGVVLVELITGTTVSSFDTTKEKGGLIMYFVSSFKNRRLSDVVDDNLKKSKLFGSQLDKVAKIASECLEVKGEARPKMKVVREALEKLVDPNCLSVNKKKGDPCDSSGMSLGGSVNIDPNKTDPVQFQFSLKKLPSPPKMSSQSEISLASRLRDTSSDHIIEDDVVSSTSDEEDELEDEKHEEEVEDSTRYNNKWYCTFRGSIVPGRTRADPRWRSTWFEEWNRVFLLVSATGLFIDPLFFYALSISKTYMCVFVDGWFAITVTVLRCMTDAMHIWNIWIQFKAITAAQRSGHRRWCLKFGRRTLFDLFVILPLPQIVLWVVTPMLLKRGSTTMVMTMFLIIFVFQYLPKIYHSVCLLRRMQSVSGFVFGTIWWGFALNMIAYFVASHAAGACWFLLGLQRTTKCLIEQCHVMPGCTNKLLASQEPLFYGTTKMVHDNARLTWAANRSARSTCLDSFNNYEYGAYGWVIYLVANANRLEKVLLPIFWGLMTMSTFGNLAATAEWVESVFIIAILTSGLILVTMLIGNIKVFLHATTSKKQAMQLRMRNIEWWMSKRKLPPNMKQRVRNYEWQRWAAMRGVDECEMIKNLPEGLRRDIKYHLCLDLVRQVPLFQHMEDLVLENICDRVKSLIFTKGETITREGDPVRRMLFVVRGHLQSSQFLRDGVKSCCMLGPGNFSGDELLSWCLRRPFIERLPPSSSTLVTLETTEAFGLEAEDVKYVTQHFRYTFVNEKVRRSARYYSPGWRTWAAVAIQLAWRRYKHRLTLTSLSFIRPRRPLSRSNSLGEDKLRLYTALLTSPKPNQDDFDY